MGRPWNSIQKGLWLATFSTLLACTTLPEAKHKKYSFPKDKVFIGKATRPYRGLGLVRSKVNFPTLDPNLDEQSLCKNYYNLAMKQLWDYAKAKGADAVVEAKTVTVLLDGKVQTHDTPECADEGGEGQVLAQGVAVEWVDPEESRP